MDNPFDFMTPNETSLYGHLNDSVFDGSKRSNASQATQVNDDADIICLECDKRHERSALVIDKLMYELEEIECDCGSTSFDDI